ncbi:hypothetical protein [Sulfuricurvum sp.]|uniref:hypothetical protein n=1 Tax=Sulfuricurvum sp. TaxID=2025608 RepID=UPI00356948E2
MALVFWLLFSGIVQLQSETLVIAAGESFGVNVLGIDEIRSIYLGKKFRLGNQKLFPLNLGIDNPLRNKFEQQVLGEDRDTLAHNWLQAHYLGHHAPKVLKSPETVAEFLTKIDNSMGYLDEDTALKYHLKILFRLKE